MKEATRASLDALFTRHPVLVAGPATSVAISAIEAYAGFSLPTDYQEFVERYGGGIVGPFPIYGCGASQAMGHSERSVVDVTEGFRLDSWPGAESNLVVSMDHAGNAFLMNGEGKITRYDHDVGSSETVAVSFEDFLVSLL